MYFIVIGLVFTVAGQVDELQDQWPPRDDTASSREEIPSNNILEDGGFSGGLRTYNDLSESVLRT